MQFSVGLDRSVQLVGSILHLQYQTNLALSKECVNVVRWFSSTGKGGLLELSEKMICKHLHLKVTENSSLPLATIVFHSGWLQE